MYYISISRPPMTTIANNLRELDYNVSYEYYRRLYLWKHYLYSRLGDRHIDAVNTMLVELDILIDQYSVGVALERITSPLHPKRLVLHEYPEVTQGSIEYLLHGKGEEVIEKRYLDVAQAESLSAIKVELNNLFYKE